MAKDIRNVIGSEIIRTIDGEEIHFKKLTVPDYALLTEYYFNEQIEKYKKIKELIDPTIFNNMVQNLNYIPSDIVNQWVLYTSSGYNRALWLMLPGKKYEEINFAKTEELDDIVLMGIGMDPVKFKKDIENMNGTTGIIVKTLLSLDTSKYTKKIEALLLEIKGWQPEETKVESPF